MLELQSLGLNVEVIETLERLHEIEAGRSLLETTALPVDVVLPSDVEPAIAEIEVAAKSKDKQPVGEVTESETEVKEEI